MNRNLSKLEKEEQVERGLRIKLIRENELKMSKTDLAKAIGTSSQFLGLVECGKANLVYRNIRALRNLSGHSADYLLFGFDDKTFTETKKYLEPYTEREILNALVLLKELSNLMRKDPNI